MVSVLDRVFCGEVKTYPLMELIEFQLKGPPSEDDTLPLAGKQRFTYQIAEEEDGEPVVMLRIGRREAKLPKRRDVHRLLQALCQTPTHGFTGPQCRERLNVANASEACRFIRRSLSNITSTVTTSAGNEQETGSRNVIPR